MTKISGMLPFTKKNDPGLILSKSTKKSVRDMHPDLKASDISLWNKDRKKAFIELIKDTYGVLLKR